MKLGFIGFGEAAFEMSKGLKTEGINDIIVFDLMHDHPIFGQLLYNRVKEVGVKIVYSPKEVIDEAEVLIVAVPGSKALETAVGLHKFLHNNTLYVDVSASSVDVKRKIWETIKDKTENFVDVAMLGPLPMHQHKVPIAASGIGTDKFIKYMEPFKMKIEKISDSPGDATAIKLVRSVFIKGLGALVLEVIEVSSKIGVTDIVVKSISNTIDEVPFEFTINRLITGNAIHAERRSHELKSAIEMMNAIEVEPLITSAAKSKLEWLAAKKLNEKFDGVTPKRFEEVITNW